MNHSELGRELYELRLARNLSQRGLALKGDHGHLTSTSISKIERGERFPNLVTLELFAKALNCRIVIEPGGTRLEPL